MRREIVIRKCSCWGRLFARRGKLLTLVETHKAWVKCLVPSRGSPVLKRVERYLEGQIKGTAAHLPIRSPEWNEVQPDTGVALRPTISTQLPWESVVQGALKHGATAYYLEAIT